jgi:hypothetical protein
MVGCLRVGGAAGWLMRATGAIRKAHKIRMRLGGGPSMLDAFSPQAERYALANVLSFAPLSRWCASASIIGNDASLRATAAARPQPGLSTDPAVSHNGKSTRKRQKNRQEVTQRQHHYAWRIFGGHKSSNQRVLRAGLESRFDGVGSIGRTLRLPPRPRRKRNPYDAVAYFWHIARLVWLAQTGCAR